MPQLRITLKSDLCAGVGKHYAAIIDLDTALDEYGLPFIPARRLKGCLREIAEEFEIPEIHAIFGTPAQDRPGSLAVSDAKLPDYDTLVAPFRDNPIKNAARITDLFCSVRAETAIENDTVKDGSLRFVRVVNHYSPLDGKELCFYADITFDEAHRDTVKKLCRGLRNIGYHRNRGFGAVSCELIDTESAGFAVHGKIESDTAEYRLTYRVFLKSDLMLPASDSSHSLDYIPGTNVLGALAGRFVKTNPGYTAEAFNSLFYSKDVRFSNLYLSDAAGSESYPAPRFLGKIKAASEQEQGIHNLIELHRKPTGKTDKPLKSGYILGNATHKEPASKIVYHNAMGKDGIGLYMQYCLSAGQYFCGEITAPGGKLQKILDLLKADEHISFGRSRTAQYSRCILCGGSIELTQKYSAPKPGTCAAFVFESDVAGFASIEQLLDALNLTEKDLCRETGLSTRVVSGYNTKWQLKKPQFGVFSAGSAIVFTVPEGYRLPDGFPYLGTHRNEGFGKLRLIVNADTYKLSGQAGTFETAANNLLTEKLLERQKLDKITAKAIEDAPKAMKGLGKSQIGRVTLMCKEANDVADFYARIESIKTKKTRESAQMLFGSRVLEAVARSDWAKQQKYILTVLTVAKYLAKCEDGGGEHE